MARNEATRKPDVTGDYHEAVTLCEVKTGECDLCRKTPMSVGKLEIPVDGNVLVAHVCPICLIEIARDILAS